MDSIHPQLKSMGVFLSASRIVGSSHMQQGTVALRSCLPLSQVSSSMTKTKLSLLLWANRIIQINHSSGSPAVQGCMQGLSKHLKSEKDYLPMCIYGPHTTIVSERSKNTCRRQRRDYFPTTVVPELLLHMKTTHLHLFLEIPYSDLVRESRQLVPHSPFTIFGCCPFAIEMKGESGQRQPNFRVREAVFKT